ncbi:MAG: SDR family oxidoreductase, partial [Nitrospinae bacterium]|nr:SDR family oxidoreductase [Nitrospinota bacterium]
ASSGIGQSIAAHYLAEGAKVIIFSRNAAKLEAVAAESPANVLVVAGDVTRSEDIHRLVDAAVERFSKVDIVVPNAGIAKVAPFADCTEEVINYQFGVNFMGAAQTVRAFLPYINEGGVILFITTFLTQVGFPGLSVYNASKAALKSLAQTLAAELAPRKIRVNSIAPGPIATPLWPAIGLPHEQLQAVAAQVTARLMPGHFGAPEDIAKAAVVLASDDVKNIYGQEIVVDGGYTIG